jgi:hypothetical protein
MWPLSQAWYGDRLSPDYHPKSVEQLRQILTDAGLVSDFWRL